MKVVLQKVTIGKFLRCFFPGEHKYHYLGIAYNHYDKGSIEHAIIKDFIEYVDSIARPKYFPKFILRLLHLYGSDNSIARVRNYFLHELKQRILNHITIMDIKTKWDEYDIRIYGHFPDVIYKRIEEVEEKFYQLSLKDSDSINSKSF